MRLSKLYATLQKYVPTVTGLRKLGRDKRERDYKTLK